MEKGLIAYYKTKFLNLEKILEEYGLKQEDIFSNPEKNKESWIISGKFYDCSLLYPSLRSMNFRDPYPDLSLLDIDVWDLKVFFAKLRTLKTVHDDIGKLLRFCIDHSSALYHLSHQIYIHVISPSTSDQHVMAVFYLMADILVNSKHAETYILAFGERLPFVMIFLHRIFCVLCDTADTMGFILRVKHVLWILEKRNIYSEDFIRKLYNIFMGLIDPEDDTPRTSLWDSYMFDNLNVMNDFMVFEPHIYSKLQHNSKFQLHDVDESAFGEEAEIPLEEAILKKFLED